MLQQISLQYFVVIIDWALTLPSDLHSGYTNTGGRITRNYQQQTTTPAPTFHHLFFFAVFSPSATMRPTNPLRTILEVERKFAPTPASISHLRHNTGHPRFTKFQYRGSQHLEDIYYDKRDILSNHGIWVRRRWCKELPPTISTTKACRNTYATGMKTCAMTNAAKLTAGSTSSSKWQAKIRKGGDRTNSAFVEVEGYETVLTTIRNQIFELRYLGTIPELGVLAHIVSDREMWIVDNKFTVVIDSTNFDHIVGEVELEVNLNSKDSVEEAQTLKKMDAGIEAFMEEYAWAFPTEDKVVGKLTVYFEWLKNKQRASAR
jgi:thiamine-triphosphatase